MKYLLGNEKIFYDFVKSIKKEDKVAIISHNDFDGVAAIVFLEKILNSQKIKSDLIYFSTYSEDMFDKHFEEMKKKKISKVFVVDIQADNAAPKGFENLRNDFDVFWIDHHPLIEGSSYEKTLKTSTPDCTTLVLFNLAEHYFDISDLNWIVCAGIVADWGFRNPENMNYVKKLYPNFNENDLKTSEIGKIVIIVNDSLIYYRHKEKKVFDALMKKDLASLEKVAKEVDKELQKVVDNYFKKAEFYPKKDLYFHYENPKFHLVSSVSSIVSMKDFGKTFIFASDIENGIVKISARNQSGKVDLGKLMKKCIEGFDSSVGGGHIYAASASFMKKDLQKFKERLLNNIN